MNRTRLTLLFFLLDLTQRGLQIILRQFKDEFRPSLFVEEFPERGLHELELVVKRGEGVDEGIFQRLRSPLGRELRDAVFVAEDVICRERGRRAWGAGGSETGFHFGGRAPTEVQLRKESCPDQRTNSECRNCLLSALAGRV